MKRTLRFALLLLAVFAVPAARSVAQIVGSDAFMKGNYVEIGVGRGGWYGTGGNAPSGYHPRTPGPTLGFVSDPDKDGFTVGTPDFCGDYFVPGYPQEGWDIQIGKDWFTAWLGAGLSPSITGSNTGYTATATEIRSTWEGSVPSHKLNIRQTTILKMDKLYFIIKVTMKNNGTADINNIYYDRTLDPDNVSTMGSLPGVLSSSGATTHNRIVYKLPNDESRSLVSAIGDLTIRKQPSPGVWDTSYYPVYLGIGSKDCRAKPYILSTGLNPGTDDSLSRLYNEDQWKNHLYNEGDTNFTDAATGLIFNIKKLKPGDSTTFFMAYVLSTADLDSAFQDMAPVWEYEGKRYESGDTIKLCRDKGSPDLKQTLNIYGGNDYSWTWSPRPGLKNLTGTENEITLGMTPVTYVANPTETFGCTDSLVLTIIPYENPDIPKPVSPVTYCRFGSPKPLAATGSPGGKLQFYTTDVGGTPFDEYTPSTGADGTFTYYVSQINGICESGRAPITVIVNPIPNLDSFTIVHPTTCGGKQGSIRFKADKSNEIYKVYFDKDGEPQVQTRTSDAFGYILIDKLGDGSYTAIYIENSFGCVSNTYFGPIDLVGPKGPKPTAANNGPLCAGQIAVFTTGTSDSTTYLWRGPDGFSSTDQNPTFTTTANSGGVYTLVSTRNDCKSLPATTTLVINPTPSEPKLKDQDLCQGTTLNVIVTPERDVTYSWSGPNAFSAATAGLIRENVQPDQSGTYYWYAISSGGCEMRDTMEVNIDPRVTLQYSNDTAFCYGDSISLFVATNTNSVTWSPATAMNDANSATPRISPAASTDYTVTAKSMHAACPDTSGTVHITVIPTPKVEGYDTLVRMNIPYTIMPIFGQDVVSYKWEPADSLSCANCPNPVINTSKNMVYVVYGTNAQGCVGKDVVSVRVFCDGANITMPNAFTPNGDNKNDIFYVRGTGFTVKSFAIYNRLGQEVFRAENFSANDPKYGWDGTFNGQPVTDAAGFVYMLEAVCLNSNNKPELIKGTVLLIK